MRVVGFRVSWVSPSATWQGNVGLLNIILWILPPLSNRWILLLKWLYIAINRTPNINCYNITLISYSSFHFIFHYPNITPNIDCFWVGTLNPTPLNP